MKFGFFQRALLTVALGLPLGAAAAETAAIQTVPVQAETAIVRSQPSRFSPIVTRLKAGDLVAVLEEIALEKPAAGDESHWLKIAYPTNATVWVHSMYIDTNLNTVIPPRLNVRSGATENHPVVGRLDRGQTITNLSVKGEWIEISPPANAFAYIAAALVTLPQKPEPATPATVTNTPPVAVEVVPAPEVATVTNAPAAMQAVESVPPVAAPAASTNEVVAAVPVVPAVRPAPEPVVPVVPEPPKPRIVTREGLVSSFTSIQAPSFFKLENLENGRVMDYLFSPTTNLVLRHYVGRHVLVTGEESLDKRWPTTPVITIQSIQVVEE